MFFHYIKQVFLEKSQLGKNILLYLPFILLGNLFHLQIIWSFFKNYSIKKILILIRKQSKYIITKKYRFYIIFLHYTVHLNNSMWSKSICMYSPQARDSRHFSARNNRLRCWGVYESYLIFFANHKHSYCKIISISFSTLSDCDQLYNLDAQMGKLCNHSTNHLTE